MVAARTNQPKDGVVLLHGISRTFRSMNKMQHALEAAGFSTLNVDYASRRKRLEELAEDIHSAITDFSGTVDGATHFVCHSMGGLLARAYLTTHPPKRLGRVVMLGTPNGGSEIADHLKNFVGYRMFFGPAGQQLVTIRDEATEALLRPTAYPVGIIAGNRSIDPISSSFFLAGPNDGRVTIAGTKIEGMSDHIVVNASHPWLIRHLPAIEQTIAFLRQGHFNNNDRNA
ncbi:lipase family alpha/beta hydrolase [Bradyrhizobium sp. SYSU BS000235]|uniref:lipase family alpha/beta hydrolase n=1 Tax=Bradyrhizobium sp. SYSU BS000235 TaxID=3411332 RepID=UPI003C78D587